MSDHKVILQGGGDHARVVVDCLQAEGRDILAIFDPKLKGNLFGVPILGEYNPEFEKEGRVIIAIGDNRIRKKVASFTRHGFTSAIHPSVIVSRHASAGTGNMLLHRSIVQAQAKIGNHVIVNTGAQIDHDCIIGDFVHLAPGVILCGTVEVGEGSFLGAGSVVIPGQKIGKWATIGAGAVVRTAIPDFAVAVGNPARVIKYNEQ